MRGLWRWVDETGAADQWFARVEVRRGAWEDIDFDTYKRAGVQPSFWDLPLAEDHFAALDPYPYTGRIVRAEMLAMRFAIGALVIGGATLFVVVVVGVVVLVKLGLH